MANIKKSVERNIVACLLGFTLSFSAWAESPVSLKSVVEIEVPVKQPDGSVVKKRQTFKTAPPGQEVIFTNTMTNISKRVADNLMLSNPIPKNMRLINVWGNGAKIEYSVDGKLFSKPENLKVKDAAGITHVATLADYTDIRWTLSLLKPNEVASVGFNAVIK